MKIVQRVAACFECPNRRYYSGGRYECAKNEILLPEHNQAIPTWCPLPDDPTAHLSSEVDRLTAELASLTTPTHPERMMMNDELLEIIESTANMLRGMCMDPAIPKHAKEAIAFRVRELDAVVDRATQEPDHG